MPVLPSVLPVLTGFCMRARLAFNRGLIMVVLKDANPILLYTILYKNSKRIIVTFFETSHDKSKSDDLGSFMQWHDF